MRWVEYSFLRNEMIHKSVAPLFGALCSLCALFMVPPSGVCVTYETTKIKKSYNKLWYTGNGILS